MQRVIQLGDSALEQKSKEVSNPESRSVQEMVAKLLLICQKKALRTAGLAAPQIGVNKRICIIRRFDIEARYEKDKKFPKSKLKKGIWEVLINPRILKRGQTLITNWEGCLSVKNGRLFGAVERPSWVKIKYLNVKGEEKELTGREFLSSVIQHEIDHLNGILFIKHITDPKNLWKEIDLDRYIRKHDDYPQVL